MVSKTKSPTLSKSRFLAGLQCPLRLWHQCHNPNLASEISPVQQAIFHMGHEVGELATRLYPRGVLVEEDHLHHEEAVETTLAAMKDLEVKAIYEAALLFNDVRIRVDILEKLGNGKWNLIEVKSSTSVKEVHLPDVAIQHHVLTGAGLDIDRVFLMHLNNRYIYDGSHLELEKLFSASDMTRKVLVYENQIFSLLSDFKDMLAKPREPGIRPGRHCRNPYECEFREYCTEEMPEHWIMELTGITQRRLNEMMAMEIQDIRDIPDSFPLTQIQDRIRRCVVYDEEYISGELRDELMDAEYPIHFLDFETVSPAIPRYARTRPYQTIPFQWSDHILYEDGTVEHKEWLCEEDKDSREEFAITLLRAMGDEGAIFIYTDYEKRIVHDLAGYLPQQRNPLQNLSGRFKDLQKLIRKYYYHPEFHGSFSLKFVLPALVPEMDYKNLAIQEGSFATLEYLRILEPSTSPQEKEEIERNLLEYCRYDTLAMLKIREEILKKI